MFHQEKHIERFSFERVSKSNKKRSSYNLCVCATLIGIRARLTRNLQEDQNTLRVGTGPIELGLEGVCGIDQVKRSWKSLVRHEMNVILSLRG